MTDYELIYIATKFINQQINRQLTLKEIATHIHLCEDNFQRLITRWSGTSPERFLHKIIMIQAGRLSNHYRDVTTSHRKLEPGNIYESHCHLVNFSEVSSAKNKDDGLDLYINYGIHLSPFGKVFIATTERGICQLSFLDKQKPLATLQYLKRTWPRAKFSKNKKNTLSLVEEIFSHGTTRKNSLSLHTKGTNFQYNVWRKLLQIPEGTVSTYKNIAQHLKTYRATQAVGRAIGTNPIAYLIPCHRIIYSSGKLGGYRWGQIRKQLILSQECIKS